MTSMLAEVPTRAESCPHSLSYCMNLGRWAEEWRSGSTPPTRVDPNLVGGGWEGNTPSNQPNSAGVPSGGDPQKTPLPQAKP